MIDPITILATSLAGSLIRLGIQEISTFVKGKLADNKFHGIVENVFSKYRDKSSVSIKSFADDEKLYFFNDTKVTDEISKILIPNKQPDYYYIGQQLEKVIINPTQIIDYEKEAKYLVELIASELESVGMFEKILTRKTMVGLNNLLEKMKSNEDEKKSLEFEKNQKIIEDGKKIEENLKDIDYEKYGLKLDYDEYHKTRLIIDDATS